MNSTKVKVATLHTDFERTMKGLNNKIITVIAAMDGGKYLTNKDIALFLSQGSSFTKTQSTKLANAVSQRLNYLYKQGIIARRNVQGKEKRYEYTNKKHVEVNSDAAEQLAENRIALHKARQLIRMLTFGQLNDLQIDIMSIQQDKFNALKKQ